MIEVIQRGKVAHVFTSPLACMRVMKLSIDELCKQLRIGVKVRFETKIIFNAFVQDVIDKMEPELKQAFLDEIIDEQLVVVRFQAVNELIQESEGSVSPEKTSEFYGVSYHRAIHMASEAKEMLRKNIMTCKAGLETRESLREAAGGARLLKKKPI